MYKVVVSDLDGTLLNPQHQISSKTHEVIHQLVAQDFRFVVATGRHHVDVDVIRQQIGLNMYLITSNGARVHGKSGELVYSQDISADIADELLSQDYGHNTYVNVYQGDAWYINQKMPEILLFNKDSGFSYTESSMKALSPEGIAKFFFIGDHEDLVLIERQLKERYGDKLNIAFSLSECLEVMDGGVSKAKALSEVLKLKGFSLEQTIGFGDGMNDYEMLSAVGKGIIMGNAHDRLKQALPYLEIGLSCAEDGVAQYLSQHLLGQPN
jgi:Cof subfamily protein (haloacid dehalogenase superfamily)